MRSRDGSYYCFRCQRVLEHADFKNSHHDTVTGERGATSVTHDECGGLVAYAVKAIKKGKGKSA